MIKTPLSTMIGGAFWTPKATILGGTSNTFDQLIKSLFTNNEQGFAYDPNDLTTMFVDATGTIPVTGAGQPVGLMLDKSKGLSLGSDIVTNGDFSAGSAGWETSGTVTIANGAANFNNEANASNVLQSNPAIVAGRIYKITYTITSITGGSVSIAMGASLGVLRTTPGTYTEYLFAKSTNIYVRSRSSGTTATVDNIVAQELAGNHAYQTNSASRPILRQNETTGAYYLEFDGSGDFLVTNSIDFTVTDKVSLFTGVRKLSDVNPATIYEFGNSIDTNNGTFVLHAPKFGTQARYNFESKGTKVSPVVSTTDATAPTSSVITNEASISTDFARIRVNGLIKQTSASDQGTGNYGNYPLYIGRRGGTSLSFNGHIYSLIGIGRLSTESETAAIEKELAKRTGVALNV